jgi:Flp pilus assembly pilin Flp
MKALRAFLLGEEGQSLLEFALLFLFIAVVAAAVLPGVRERIKAAFRIGGEQMDRATGAAAGGD